MMSFIFWSLVAPAALIAVLAVLVLTLINMLANRQMHFVKPEKGNIVFILKGNDPKLIIPNVNGHKMAKGRDPSGRQWLTKLKATIHNTALSKEDQEKEQKKEMREAFQKDLCRGTRHIQWLLWNKLGIRFVSWLWPIVHVMGMTISTNRLKESVDPSAGVRDYVKTDTGWIDSLRFIFNRPVVIEGVECPGENARVGMVLFLTVQVVIPAWPVFTFKDKGFMQALDSVVIAGVIDFFANFKAPVTEDRYDPKSKTKKPISYGIWLSMPKDMGSPLVEHILSLNATAEFYDQIAQSEAHLPEADRELTNFLDALLGGRPKVRRFGTAVSKTMSKGAIDHLGLAIIDVDLVTWEADQTTQALAASLQEQELKTRKALGVVAEAEGKARAINVEGEAEAGRLEKLAKALRGDGGDPNVAAEAVARMETMRHVAGSRLTTLVNGSGTSIMIPASPPSKPDSE